MDKIKSDKLKESAFARLKALPHLREACMNCKMCSLGWAKATKDDQKHDPHVFSNRIISPPMFMIVGQNPGWNEVIEGEPFVGASGDNFNKALEDTLYTRDDFYITNAVKCWTRKNQAPDQDSIDKCEPFLKMEIAIIKPKLVITFGAVSFRLMCGKLPFYESMSKIVNSEKFGVKVFPIYHPSPLNLADPDKRIRFFKDIRMLGQIMDHYFVPF